MGCGGLGLGAGLGGRAGGQGWGGGESRQVLLPLLLLALISHERAFRKKVASRDVIQ